MRLRLPAAEVEALTPICAGSLPARGRGDRPGRDQGLFAAIFERTFAVTGALNVLTLGRGGDGDPASLLTLADRRLPQLAPVWAMGLTQGRLAVLDLAADGGAGALTAVAALPLGLALAWVLLAVVNVAAFGWRLPMRVFPGDWLGCWRRWPAGGGAGQR
jgi:putative ABC transport system permease protein